MLTTKRHRRKDQGLRNKYLGMNPTYVIHKLCEFSQVNLSLYIYILNVSRGIMISTFQ